MTHAEREKIIDDLIEIVCKEQVLSIRKHKLTAFKDNITDKYNEKHPDISRFTKLIDTLIEGCEVK